MDFDMGKKKKSKKKIVLIVLIVIFVLLAGAAAYYFFFMKEEPVKKEPKIVKKLQIVDEDSNKRPLAIMIDNNVGTDDHKGLQEAYITYEAIVEGSLSRIMVVYKDKEVDPIGPIRSSRHYFLDYALESDALYAHFGWSPYAQRDIRELGVNNINGMTASAPYTRVRDYVAPHNVFTSTEKLYATAEKMGYSTTTDNWKLLNYNVDEVNLDKKYKDDVNVKSVKEISFNYMKGEERKFTYDKESKTYLRC